MTIGMSHGIYHRLDPSRAGVLVIRMWLIFPGPCDTDYEFECDNDHCTMGTSMYDPLRHSRLSYQQGGTNRVSELVTE